MNSSHPSRGEADELTVRYEQLRQHALSCRTGAAMLMLFLREGMSNWLQAVVGTSAQREPRLPPLPEPTCNQVLVGIWVDAILQAAGPTTSTEFIRS